MIEPARHVPLRPIRWSESNATAAIEDIVADGLEHFDAERFWPAHPLDEGIRDGHTSFYFGATGVIWGIDYLVRVGATNARFDFRPVLNHETGLDPPDLASPSASRRGTMRSSRPFMIKIAQVTRRATPTSDSVAV